MTEPVTRVVVVDHHPMVIYGLAALLIGMPDMSLVASARSGREALKVCREHRPDLVVIDAVMRDGDGIEVTRRLREELPGARVLILSVGDDDESLFGALRAGARGYVLKVADHEQMSRALRSVAAGEAVFSSEVAGRVLQHFASDTPAAPGRLNGLSSVECEVLPRIHLCGRLAVDLRGRAVEGNLTGRLGAIFAYLAACRHRPVRRDELIDALWPSAPPASPDAALRTLLSRLRRALGADLLQGRAQLVLVLPKDAWIDLEAAAEAIGRAEHAVARGDWQAAWNAAQLALDVSSRGFLAGYDAPWIDERRREVDELTNVALECIATAGLGLGGSRIAAGERSACSLIGRAPYRESGYRLLMEAQAARGNVAEALQVYETLRLLLRDELGTTPGPSIKALHERLLLGAAA
jgi:DNA-binding NarL/FixJ family response regulator/DNA-binding SARP family transcriptional activator